MNIPRGVSRIIDILNKNGYSAYVVGGAVRDAIMGRAANDYDVTTSAMPQEIERIFSDLTTTGVGKSFGTVVVYDGDISVEVTTFRKESTYSDGRHPDEVLYAHTVEEDLVRRDFTMNAIAYNAKEGFIDPCGGIHDINNRIIRCVGDAKTRFTEDKLRVLRAVRFFSQLGFEVEEKTNDAIHSLANDLGGLSKERITAEICKLLCGENVKRALMDYRDIVCNVVPALGIINGYDQNNPHHCFELYEHTVNCVSYIENDLHLRLTALFHDTGKPLCRTIDSEGIYHFKGHPAVSESITSAALKEMRLPTKLCEKICLLIKYHDERMKPERVMIKRMLSKLGSEAFFDLLKMQRVDILSQNPKFYYRLENQNRIYQLAKEIIEEGTALNTKDLKINGDDIISLGIKPGKQVGDILNSVLNAVVEERVENEKESLLNYVKRIIGGKINGKF